MMIQSNSFNRGNDFSQNSLKRVRQKLFILRGVLVGLALLPAYFAITFSIPTFNQVAPVLFGMVILACLGAAAGYIVSNLVGSFDFAIPAGFLHQREATPGPSPMQQEFTDMDWDDRMQDSPVKHRSWDYDERVVRHIFSGDWRDEYSSSSSRDEDARRDGYI